MLPLARYRFHWRVSAPIHLPAYAGSMLRGAFGHALRRLACMTRQADCAACPLLHAVDEVAELEQRLSGSCSIGRRRGRLMSPFLQGPQPRLSPARGREQAGRRSLGPRILL